MKKLVFTALLGMLSVSGFSMTETSNERVSFDKVVFEDCAIAAHETIATIKLEMEMSEWEEDYYWYSFYSACMNR
ncbi:hypothetical protein NYQ10_07480 [Flavobacterium johnsoniae]|uniref:hypothetical protein n=1 Tax=Flavobacterium johnsoniae TaxID=986 RepID=UPI0025B0680C|nr:hypothetical protein [Flavobacterium johnsoniae]WJS96294.1 hypothetical protein NYQ10_07480 [Flavobacterium johnsoniae]